MKHLLAFLILSVASISTYASDSSDNFIFLRDHLQNYGVQGDAKLNHRMFSDDGEGTCSLSFSFVNNEYVDITFDFQIDGLLGYFKSYSGTERFLITEFLPESTYGDMSFSSVSESGLRIGAVLFKPNQYSSVYQNGGYHLSLKISDKKFYNCFDSNLAGY